MDIHTFMTNYREAFGERAELPIAFWYSDKQESETEKIVPWNSFPGSPPFLRT